MGIAHHSNYPVWFEVGRTDFFKKIGFPYSEVESKGFLLPLTDMKCKFIKPAKYEDSIVIKTQISRIMHVKVCFHYDVYNKEVGTLIAAGETNHGWTDRQLNPLVIEEKFPELYKALTCHVIKNSY
jgi:acyl-CoA thioester hydrolase